VILLDTHIWIWLANEQEELSAYHAQIIADHRSDGLGISAISCWEVAKLVEYGRLNLACDLETWMEAALDLPGIQVIELTPTVAIESTKLPGAFHRDPADQIIVATARTYRLDLLTVDDKILKYEHVHTL
jgi:PIN domain nuclease of toxin-antitoxin system